MAAKLVRRKAKQEKEEKEHKQQKEQKQEKERKQRAPSFRFEFQCDNQSRALDHAVNAAKSQRREEHALCFMPWESQIDEGVSMTAFFFAVVSSFE